MLCNTSKCFSHITDTAKPLLEVILNDDSLNSIVLSKLHFLNIENLKIDVSIPDDHFEQLLELIKNSSLERLDISTICYGEEEDKAYKFFDPELYKNKDLTHLNIAANDIGYQGAKQLKQLLSYLNEISDDGLASIASVFPHCRALAHLDLSSNSFNRLESLTRVLDLQT